MPWWATVLVALGSAVLGALASGGAQAWLARQDRETRKKVAARTVMGDIAIASHLFGRVAEGGGAVGIDHDFRPALATWAEYRPDLIGEVSLAEWAEVSQFYDGLALVAGSAGQAPVSPRDIAVARSQVALAERAWKVIRRHIGGSDAEVAEMVEKLKGHGAD